MASFGHSINDIAAVMGISAAKLRSAHNRGADDIAHGRNTKAAVLVLQHNRARGNLKTTLMSSLVKQAEAGNTRAALGLLDKLFPDPAADSGDTSDLEAKKQFSNFMHKIEEGFRTAAQRAKNDNSAEPPIEAEATETPPPK